MTKLTMSTESGKIVLTKKDLLMVSSLLETIAKNPDLIKCLKDTSGENVVVSDVTIKIMSGVWTTVPYPAYLPPGTAVVFYNDNDCDVRLVFTEGKDRLKPHTFKIPAQGTKKVSVSSGPAADARCDLYRLPENQKLTGTGNGADMKIDNP